MTVIVIWFLNMFLVIFAFSCKILAKIIFLFYFSLFINILLNVPFVII